MAMHFSGVWRNFCGAQCEEQRSCKKWKESWRREVFFLEFSESLKDKVSFHYIYREKYGESAITLGNRVWVQWPTWCSRISLLLTLCGLPCPFFPININSFNTLCQRWAALSFFLSTLIDSTHYDRGGLAGRMLERGWSIPPLPPTSIYYFALSITIFTIFYSVLLLLYYCSIYYTFS